MIGWIVRKFIGSKNEREVKRLQDQTHLQPWAAGPRDVYVRIVPTRISGRCIEPR